MNNFYEDDLAYVHDTGFCDLARHAGQMILENLNNDTYRGCKVVDLGCGSGVIAKILDDAGYKVFGVDISPSFIKLCKKRVPNGDFITYSFYDAQLPTSKCVISTSECFNYVSPESDDLMMLFKKVYNALDSDGLFIFDILINDDQLSSSDANYILDHEDWSMFVRVIKDFEKNLLTRDVTLFRKINDGYRKSKETHKAKILHLDRITDQLREVGFEVKLFNSYGELKFEPGQIGLLCKKA